MFTVCSSLQSAFAPLKEDLEKLLLVFAMVVERKEPENGLIWDMAIGEVVGSAIRRRIT